MQTKTRYYYKHLGDFRRELREAIPAPILQELHQPTAWKHFAMVLRQLLIAGIAIWTALQVDRIWIWLPGAIVIGWIAFDFTVLLHEVVHDAVFAKKRPKFNTLLGWLYALPSGISRSQFTRWHLDHHEELGSWTDDPKRAHLTPKINRRWYKFLYLTPALFPIYFRGAAKEAKTYPPDLQKKIQIERLATISLHAVVMALLIWTTGLSGFAKAYAIPYFFIFPIAFTINRMGQHYNVNPKDIAQWTTLMKGSFFWDFVFLYSNYHLEHHYFPGVPCYHLPRLQRLLQPLYNRHGMVPQTYSKILYGWFIQNQAPHTDWSCPDDAAPPSSAEYSEKSISSQESTSLLSLGKTKQKDI